MTIFAPFPERMVGNVPTLCPVCNRQIDRDDLTIEQKQFLIDATVYHEISAEYQHLQTLDSLLRRYPGTRHPLVTSKLRKRLFGDDDEVEVSHVIDSTEGFRDFLERCHFDHFRRRPFVYGLVQRYQQDVASMLVTCANCENQYAILPSEYYHSIG